MTTMYDENEKPIGTKCDCGEETKFVPYVWAHLDIELLFTCQKCGAKATIYRGEVM